MWRKRLNVKVIQEASNPFQVVLKNYPRTPLSDIYHFMLKMTWFRFILLLALGYFVFNVIFALIFMAGGGGITHMSNTFWNCFVFSVQTSSTIGYGLFSPQTDYAHTVVSIEAGLSLLFTALATGFTFAKFSRPFSRVIFSNNALITQYDGCPTFMFRSGNARNNQIIDASVQVTIALDYVSQEGIAMRKITDLALARNQSPLFSFTWTVMHKIDENSPLYGMDATELAEKNALVIISLTGIDETFSQTIHAKHYYRYSDFVFDKYFATMVEPMDPHHELPVINFEMFHQLTTTP
jgi:inward rectifier potassium channel